MILSHYPSRRAHAALGAVCCLGLGRFGLSAARPIDDPVAPDLRADHDQTRAEPDLGEAETAPM